MLDALIDALIDALKTSESAEATDPGSPEDEVHFL